MKEVVSTTDMVLITEDVVVTLGGVSVVVHRMVLLGVILVDLLVEEGGFLDQPQGAIVSDISVMINNNKTILSKKVENFGTRSTGVLAAEVVEEDPVAIVMAVLILVGVVDIAKEMGADIAMQLPDIVKGTAEDIGLEGLLKEETETILVADMVIRKEEAEKVEAAIVEALVVETLSLLVLVKITVSWPNAIDVISVNETCFLYQTC